MNAKSVRDKTVRDAKCNLILDAARKVFAAKGFYESRLEDIAGEAGFSKASLYNYYADKDEIFLNLAIREFENLLSSLVAVTNTDQPFFVNLERHIRTSLTFFGEHFAFMVSATNFHVTLRINQERMVEQHKIISEKFSDYYHSILSFHRELIEKAQQKGELSSRVSAENISRYISSLIRGTFIEWKMRGVQGDTEKETASLLAFIRSGIGSADPEDSGPVQSAGKQ